jgi:hypothetical protein
MPESAERQITADATWDFRRDVLCILPSPAGGRVAPGAPDSNVRRRPGADPQRSGRPAHRSRFAEDNRSSSPDR